jgi:CHAD domain-containing protein
MRSISFDMDEVGGRRAACSKGWGDAVGSQHRTRESGVERAVGRARDQLSKAIRLLDREPEPDRDSTIHEVRKRIKKARAMIRLARSSVGRKAIEKADRRLREAARPFSAVRDATVLVATLDDLADRSRDLAPLVDFTEARGELEAHRDRVAFERLDEGHAFARASKILRSTRRRLGKWDLTGDDAEPIGAYKLAYRRGREAFEAATADPSAESLHELRKRVKALAHQLKTVEADPAGPVARLRRLAGLLADELGEVHDLDILREFLADRDASSPIFGPLDRRKLSLRHSALQRAGVVFHDRPRAFAKMLEAATEQVELARLED